MLWRRGRHSSLRHRHPRPRLGRMVEEVTKMTRTFQMTILMTMTMTAETVAVDHQDHQGHRGHQEMHLANRVVGAAAPVVVGFRVGEAAALMMVTDTRQQIRALQVALAVAFH